MKNEYWNSLLTEKSWKILQELKRKYDFILIGGWAVYLYTKMQKSKDIDIVIDIKELEKLKHEGIEKNENLKKYEIKKEEVDIDIYVEYFSKLAIPVEDIKKFTLSIGGFKVVCPELLLVLKQEAYRNRENSVKGEKDRLDIISILLFTEINFDMYYSIVKKYNKNFFADDLKKLIKNFKEYDILSITPRELKLRKNKILERINKKD